MPNWCSTNIEIAHKDTDKVYKLAELITEWTSQNYMDNDFGKNWLGNIVLGSGTGTVDSNENTDVNCRGSLEGSFIDGGKLCINTETAWAPMMNMWKLIVDKYLPGAEITYSATEYGSELFWTNDSNLAGKYILSVYGEEELYLDEREILQYLREALHTHENSLQSLIEKANDTLDDCYINRWDYVSIEDVNR